MKMKIMLGIFCSLLFLTVNAQQSLAASVECTSATITSVGALGWERSPSSSFKVSATCQTGQWSGDLMFYIMKGSMAKSNYAAALTAMSLKQNVKLTVAKARNNSLILVMTLLPTSNP